MSDEAIVIDEEVTEVQQDEGEIELDLDSDLLDDGLPEAEDEEADEDEPGEDQEESQKPNNPVKQLRDAHRELKKKLQLEQQEKLRLQQQLETFKKPVVEELPPEPDLSDEGIDYDPVVFKQKWAEWNAQKNKIEQQKQEANKSQEQAQQKWQQKLQAYEQGKVNYKGIAEAESTVTSTLDLNQQGVIVSYANDPAFVVWVLGKNPVALSQLSNIKDPIEYAIKVREIEQKAMEKMKAKPKPTPEVVVKGKTSAPPSNLQKQLDKLREEGRISEAVAFKRKHNLK